MVCCTEGPGSGLTGAGDWVPAFCRGSGPSHWLDPSWNWQNHNTNVYHAIWMIFKWLGQHVTTLAAQKEMGSLILMEDSRVVTHLCGWAYGTPTQQHPMGFISIFKAQHCLVLISSLDYLAPVQWDVDKGKRMRGGHVNTWYHDTKSKSTELRKD